jgi:serine/threonine protein kinase|tara:strand:+ start:207 stop:350 length:144 start_codon:yes stop_codon:yes gene_type:complete
MPEKIEKSVRIKDFQVIKEIGKGGFGTVFLVKPSEEARDFINIELSK